MASRIACTSDYVEFACHMQAGRADSSGVTKACGKLADKHPIWGVPPRGETHGMKKHRDYYELIAELPAPLPEPHALGQIRAGGRVVRRNHRVIMG